jgi:hypothetical protein
MKKLLSFGTILLGAAAAAGCGPSKEEFEAAKASLADTQTRLSRSEDEGAKLRQDLATADQARADAEAKVSDLEKKVSTNEADLARAKESLRSAEGAAAAARQEKEKGTADLAKATSGLQTAEKQASEFREKVRTLEASLSEKENAMARLQSEAEAAVAKARDLENQRGQPTPAAAGAPDALGRLSYSGTEAVLPYLVLPLSFQAKKGEVLRWTWTIVDAPADLASEALDFVVIAPDGTKADQARAGVEKKEGTGTVTIPAEGRWTILWWNRHPTGRFSVRYEASLAAVQ